jgi:replicative DNA helicase
VKTLPHSIEAEQATLGAMMIDPTGIAAEKAIAILKTGNQFYDPFHQEIFTAMLNLMEYNRHIDTISVPLEMQCDPEERHKIIDMAQFAGTPQMVERHANIVLEEAKLRRLIEIGISIIDKCYRKDGTFREIKNDLEAKILAMETEDSFGLRHIGEYLPDVYEEISKIQERGGGLLGLATGFPDLDRKLGGLRESDLILLGGSTSQGKTLLAANISENIAIAGNAVVVFSLEMSGMKVFKRMLLSRAGMNSYDILHTIADTQWQRLSDSMIKLSSLPLYLDESSGLAPMDIRGRLRKLMRKIDVKFVCVDYLQLMTAPGHDRENRNQTISYITAQLKAIAKDFKVPVLALSQLSRDHLRRAEKGPVLSDLRDSGSLEQDADIVMLIYRPEQLLSFDAQMEDRESLRGKTNLMVAKHRDGDTGNIDLRFNKALVRFESLSHQSAI